MKKTITEKFNDEGKLIERIVEEITNEYPNNYPKLGTGIKPNEPVVTLCYGCLPTV